MAAWSLLPACSPNRWEMWQGHRAQQGSSLKARRRWQFYSSVLFTDELAVASSLHWGLCRVVRLNPIPPVELHLRVILRGQPEFRAWPSCFPWMTKAWVSYEHGVTYLFIKTVYKEDFFPFLAIADTSSREKPLCSKLTTSSPSSDEASLLFSFAGSSRTICNPWSQQWATHARYACLPFSICSTCLRHSTACRSRAAGETALCV